jgi:hypothetical protein
MGEFVVFMGFAALVWLIVRTHRQAKLSYAFDKLAARYLGRRSRTPAGFPQATLPFRGSFVRLSAVSAWHRLAKHRTRLVADWPDRRLRLELRPAQSPGGDGNLLAGVAFTPNLTGSNRADDLRTPVAPPRHQKSFQISRAEDLPPEDCWDVSTDDEAAGRLILSPACLWYLNQLASLTRRPVTLRIRHGNFQLQVRGHVRNPKRLEELTGQMLEVYSQALLSQREGLEFVDEQSPQVIEQLICPICNGPIAGEIAICTRCRTPHCKDCWQYNGKCATFGCGAEKFATKPANPSPNRLRTS